MKDAKRNKRKGVPRYGGDLKGGLWDYETRMVEFTEEKKIQQTIVPGLKQDIYSLPNPVRLWW
jgi:hypothetical protein